MKKIIFALTVILVLSSCAAKESTVVSDTVTVCQNEVPLIKNPSEKNIKTTVIIDPGHGFADPGSTPEYLSVPECEITVRASLLLKSSLEHKGYTVILTHDGITYPDEYTLTSNADRLGIEYEWGDGKIRDDGKFSPYERCVFANAEAKKSGGKFLFISLHTNSIDGSPDVCGASIDWYECNADGGKIEKAALSLSEKLGSELGTALKLYEDSFDDAYIVTKYTDMPSFLIEMGYGSNPFDANNLQNGNWLREFCRIIAETVAVFY